MIIMQRFNIFNFTVLILFQKNFDVVVKGVVILTSAWINSSTFYVDIYHDFYAHYAMVSEFYLYGFSL